MKKIRPVILFFIGSLVILLVMSLFYFNFYQNNPEEVQHLRLEEWTQPAQVAGNLPTTSFDILFTGEEFSLFTIEDDGNQRIIQHSSLDFNGKTQQASEIARAGQVGSPQAIVYGEEEYIFYFAGTSSSDQNLMVKKLNNNSEPITLEEDISFPGSLSLATTNDLLVLAYIERDEESGRNVLSTKGYGDLNGEQVFSNTHSFEPGVNYPKLAAIGDEVFMAWHQRNPETMFISGDQDTFNRYLLNISQLDTGTGEIETTVDLGEAYDDYSNLDITVFNNQLWLSWVKYDRDLRDNIIKTGYLNNGGEYQEIFRRPGFNPALLTSDDEKALIYSQELELRGQAGLFINYFNEADNRSNNERIFPALNLSSKSRVVDHERGQHLFWAEAASQGSDIYYSNTIAPAEIGVMELIGFNTIESSMELLSSLGIYLFYPIVGFNYGLVHILFPVFIAALIIFLLSKKFQRFNNLANDSPLVSFISIAAGIVIFNLLVNGNLQYLFFIYQPPANQVPIIFGVITLVSLGFIYFLNYDKAHSLYIGIGTALLWFYWLNQAILVYGLHSFFV